MKLYIYNYYELLMLFYLYSFLGWCFESTYVSICEKRPVNRGFLRSPLLPLYGSGAVSVLFFSAPFFNFFPFILTSKLFFLFLGFSFACFSARCFLIFCHSFAVISSEFQLSAIIPAFLIICIYKCNPHIPFYLQNKVFKYFISSLFARNHKLRFPSLQTFIHLPAYNAFHLEKAIVSYAKILLKFLKKSC